MQQSKNPFIPGIILLIHSQSLRNLIIPCIISSISLISKMSWVTTIYPLGMEVILMRENKDSSSPLLAGINLWECPKLVATKKRMRKAKVRMMPIMVRMLGKIKFKWNQIIQKSPKVFIRNRPKSTKTKFKTLFLLTSQSAPFWKQSKLVNQQFHSSQSMATQLQSNSSIAYKRSTQILSDHMTLKSSQQMRTKNKWFWMSIIRYPRMVLLKSIRKSWRNN